ncbi:MAG: hypothetical protein RCG15_03060 [Candidatus Rickettsia vulgarisii]
MSNSYNEKTNITPSQVIAPNRANRNSVQSVDSGYESDESKEEVIQEVISDGVKAHEKDIKDLSNKMYKAVVDARKSNPKSAPVILTVDAVMARITMAGKNFYNYLSDEKIEELCSNLSLSIEQSKSLMYDFQQEKIDKQLKNLFINKKEDSKANKTELEILSRAANEVADSFIKELNYSRNNPKDLSPEVANFKAYATKRNLLNLLMPISNDSGNNEEHLKRSKAFLEKIIHHVHIPNELENNLYKYMKKTSLHALINQEAQKFFSKDGELPKKDGFVLDDKKLTEENIRNFSNSINKIIEGESQNINKLIESENRKAISEQFLQNIIRDIPTKKRVKITREQDDKITKQLLPVINQLNPEQLNANLQSEIIDSLVLKKTMVLIFS